MENRDKGSCENPNGSTSQLIVKPLAVGQLGIQESKLIASTIGKGRARLFLKPTESEISDKDVRALRENLVQHSVCP